MLIGMDALDGIVPIRVKKNHNQQFSVFPNVRRRFKIKFYCRGWHASSGDRAPPRHRGNPRTACVITCRYNKFELLFAFEIGTHLLNGANACFVQMELTPPIREIENKEMAMSGSTLLKRRRTVSGGAGQPGVPRAQSRLRFTASRMHRRSVYSDI
jgi:hypothetical protein